MRTMHLKPPTVSDQLRVLDGIRDVLLAMAQTDDSAGGPQAALEFLATSLDIASSTLASTLQYVVVDDAKVNVLENETRNGEGFPNPYDHLSAASDPLRRPTESPTTISN